MGHKRPAGILLVQTGGTPVPLEMLVSRGALHDCGGLSATRIRTNLRRVVPLVVAPSTSRSQGMSAKKMTISVVPGVVTQLKFEPVGMGVRSTASSEVSA